MSARAARGPAWAALCALALPACGAGAQRGNAGSPTTPPPQGAPQPTPRASAPATGDAAQLESLRDRVAANEPAALRAVGFSLEPADGARDITGDAASDERVSRADVVARADDSAALLVVSTCGNVTLATMRWDRGRWASAEHVPLVRGMMPGRCAQTDARAESVALSSDVRREIVVVVTTQDATGDTLRGPFLSVYQLRASGVLGALLRDAPFGDTNDDTGATTTGQYFVIEDVPAPRDLHVAIRPGHAGPGGAPPNQIVRRRYSLRGARLEVSQETTQAADEI